MEFFSVHTSFSNRQDAARLSKIIVEKRLAACANLLPANSIYRWKGKLECEDEVLVIFKTDKKTYPALEKELAELHPYQIPMIVALPIQAGSESYVAWLSENLTPGSGEKKEK